MGPRNHVFDACPDAPVERGNFLEKGTLVKYRDTLQSPVRKELNQL